ncbi:MAG: DUF4037 domain-containing protein [Candidatus Aenigmatarchaeota archaeon]
MKKEKLLKEARKVVRALQKLPEVKAVGLYGSLGRGYADRFTKEFDIFVLCRDFPSKKSRKAALGPVIEKWRSEYERHHQVDVYDTPGIKDCACWYLKVPEVQHMVDCFKAKRPPHHDLVNYIANGKVLWDPKGLLKGWKRVFARYPDWLRKEKMGMLTGIFRFTRGEVVRTALARGNVNYLQVRLAEVKNMLDEVVYALNRTYYAWGSISGKWSFKDYRKFRLLPRGWFTQLARFNDLRGSSLRQRIRVLDRLAEGTLRIVKREMPGLDIRTKDFD